MPDLKKVFEACKKATESTGLLPSCLELSDRSITELRAHLELTEGLEVVGVSPFALTIKTKDKGQRVGQSSIISFAHVPQIIAALDYLKAAQAYIDQFGKAREALLNLAVTSKPDISSLQTKQKIDQKLFEFLKEVDPTDASVKDALLLEVKNPDTVEKLLLSAVDSSWD